MLLQLCQNSDGHTSRGEARKRRRGEGKTHESLKHKNAECPCPAKAPHHLRAAPCGARCQWAESIFSSRKASSNTALPVQVGAQAEPPTDKQQKAGAGAFPAAPSVEAPRRRPPRASSSARPSGQFTRWIAKAQREGTTSPSHGSRGRGQTPWTQTREEKQQDTNRGDDTISRR